MEVDNFNIGLHSICTKRTRQNTESEKKSGSRWALPFKQKKKNFILSHTKHCSPIYDLALVSVLATKDVFVYQIADGKVRWRFWNLEGSFFSFLIKFPPANAVFVREENIKVLFLSKLLKFVTAVQILKKFNYSICNRQCNAIYCLCLGVSNLFMVPFFWIYFQNTSFVSDYCSIWNFFSELNPIVL